MAKYQLDSLIWLILHLKSVTDEVIVIKMLLLIILAQYGYYKIIYIFINISEALPYYGRASNIVMKILWLNKLQ